MICPRCNGTREVGPCFVDGVDANGRRWCDVRMMPCLTCDGTGEVDDRYPEWRERGQAMRHARLERGETLREFCQRTGADPGTRSRMERGVIEPVEVEE